MQSAAISLGHHARVPAQLIAETHKPRALQILNHLLTLCNPNNPEVWIDQGLLGAKLGIHRDTVGNWIRYLEGVGRLVFLGFRPDGRRKRYLIKFPTLKETLLEENPVHKPSNATSGEITKRPPVKPSDDLRQFHRNINKEEETNKKEQTVVDLAKKEFSSNEKIAIKQKLKALGVFKQSIERLLDRHAIEQIELQLKHLQHQIDRGAHIEKPAPWLISALEGKYVLPEVLNPEILKERQRENTAREASITAQNAKFALDEGKLDDAKDLATKSLQLAKNALAETVLEEIQKLLMRAEKIREARTNTPKELLIAIRQEEEQKELIKMRKWGKRDAEILSSAFFKNLVDAVVDQRLLAAG